MFLSTINKTQWLFNYTAQRWQQMNPFFGLYKMRSRCWLSLRIILLSSVSHIWCMDHFWVHLTNMFHYELSHRSYQTKEEVNAKFKDLTKEVKIFKKKFITISPMNCRKKMKIQFWRRLRSNTKSNMTKPTLHNKMFGMLENLLRIYNLFFICAM